MLVLRPGDLLAGQADGIDLICECDRPSHVQQSDVPVQIFLPVVLWVDDDFINCDDLLCSGLIPGQCRQYSHQSCSKK